MRSVNIRNNFNTNLWVKSKTKQLLAFEVFMFRLRYSHADLSSRCEYCYRFILFKCYCIRMFKGTNKMHKCKPDAWVPTETVECQWCDALFGFPRSILLPFAFLLYRCFFVTCSIIIKFKHFDLDTKCCWLRTDVCNLTETQTLLTGKPFSS